ncbi:MAG: hypothetical protein PHY93_08540 [Bacteriovorax sp.]|nr:hypothetical protein [Bacteriovorax sp.]
MKKKKKSAKCRQGNSIIYYDEKHSSEERIKPNNWRQIVPFTTTAIKKTKGE